MEQRDYLERQIGEIGRVLGKLLSNLLELENKGQVNGGIEITTQALKNELDFDIQKLLDIHTEDFISTLKIEKHLTNENLSQLAEILLLIADNEQDKNPKLYEKCLMLFQYLEKIENVYSLDRQWKIERMKNKL